MSQQTDEQEPQANRNMQRIVSSGPTEETIGKEVQIAREGLVEVDETESDIEPSNTRRVLREDEQHAARAKDDVKNLIGRRTTRALIPGIDQTHHAAEHQDRRQDCETGEIELRADQVHGGRLRFEPLVSPILYTARLGVFTAPRLALVICLLLAV